MLIRVGALLLTGALVQVPGLLLRQATPAEIRASIAADPNAKALQAEIARIETVAPDAAIGHVVTGLHAKGGNASRALLAGVRFYDVSYEMDKRPGLKPRR